jgi:mono/diheme cytochrome c family protein
MSRTCWAIGALLLTLGIASPLAAGEPNLTPQFLKSDPQIVKGRQVFLIRCTYCHAKRGPGKAPTLRPSVRTPDFIYERISKGFMGMPPWEFVLPQDEREALVAYILSDPDKY